MCCVHTIHKFDIVMQHIHQKYEQFPHPFTSLLWLIFGLQIAQYCEMFFGKPMVLLENPSK